MSEEIDFNQDRTVVAGFCFTTGWCLLTKTGFSRVRFVECTKVCKSFQSNHMAAVLSLPLAPYSLTALMADEADAEWPAFALEEATMSVALA